MTDDDFKRIGDLIDEKVSKAVSKAVSEAFDKALPPIKEHLNQHDLQFISLHKILISIERRLTYHEGLFKNSKKQLTTYKDNLHRLDRRLVVAETALDIFPSEEDLLS